MCGADDPHAAAGEGATARGGGGLMGDQPAAEEPPDGRGEDGRHERTGEQHEVRPILVAAAEPPDLVVREA